MENKVVLFAFQGDLLCFAHVLMNALDLHARGHEARIVFEGRSVTLVAGLERQDGQFHGLYAKAKGLGLVAGACKACAAKLEATEAVEAAGLPLLEGVMGHPSMAEWMARGFTVVTL